MVNGVDGYVVSASSHVGVRVDDPHQRSLKS